MISVEYEGAVLGATAPYWPHNVCSVSWAYSSLCSFAIHYLHSPLQKF